MFGHASSAPQVDSVSVNYEREAQCVHAWRARVQSSHRCRTDWSGSRTFPRDVGSLTLTLSLLLLVLLALRSGDRCGREFGSKLGEGGAVDLWTGSAEKGS